MECLKLLKPHINIYLPTRTILNVGISWSNCLPKKGEIYKVSIYIYIYIYIYSYKSKYEKVGIVSIGIIIYL